VFFVLAAGLATWLVRRGDPPLSPVERALVGEWGRAETDSGFSFATRARGPMTRPWLVQEFAIDRSCRQWIVSADDTSHCFLHVEGRWRVVGDAIRFEKQPPGARRVLEDIGTQIERRTGLPLASSSSYLSATHDVPFQLVGTDDLKLMFPNQDRPDWVRLPGSFKDRPRLSVKQAGDAGMASP
jgi:hypothetical protein